MSCLPDPSAIEPVLNVGFEFIQLLAASSGIMETLGNLWETVKGGFAYTSYLVIGISSLTIMFFWMILNVLGFGSGTDSLDAVDAAEAIEGADAVDGLDAADAADAGDAADSNASVFTFRSILAFFGGFGWGGILGMELGLSPIGSFLVSIPIGLFFFFASYGVLLFLLSMSASGTLDYKNAIGETGEVYIDIPPNRSGSGKIRVKVQGRLKTVSAYNASDIRAETHSRVRVVDQIDSSTLLVKPLEAESGQRSPTTSEEEDRKKND